MNNRSAQYAFSRLPARALVAALAACICLLACAGAASAAAPNVTIGSYPPLNAQSGTFSFDADGPALKFQCKLDAGAFGDCSSPLQLFNLTVASHTFSVRAIGMDNSIGTPAVYTWSIDVTDPNVPLLSAPAHNLQTNDSTPTFSGTAEPFAHVPIFDGSTQLGNPQAGANGVWSYTPLAPLADGTHFWRARAIDAAGNRSDFTALRTLKIDSQAPATPVVSVPAAAAKVNTRTPQITGTSEPQSTVIVSDGPTQICSTTTDLGGSWSCVSSQSLPDGPHVLNVFSRDAAGNESATAQRAFELDATPPPAPTLEAPVDELATTATSITVEGTASPIAVVKVLVNGVEVADVTAGPDGSWSHSFDELVEGDYAYSAKEVDDFGNRSAASNVARVRIDRTPPSVTIPTHPPVRTNQTIADFALSASEPNVDFECAFDDGDWEPCDDEPSYSGLSVETHHFKARATDRAGNLGEANVFTWTVDLTQPDAPVIDAPTEGALLTTARPSFSGHAEPGAAVELFVDGSSLGTAPANGVTGSWALTPGSSLAQGVAQVKARAIDVAGNVGEFGATRQLTIDSIAPVTTIHGAPTAPTRADTVSITFTADDPQASFSCRIDAAVYAPCASSLTTPQLTEGAHTINVRAKDVAGNVELPAQQVTFTIDRTAPVGQSVLVAGSAGSDGIPGFQIASDDPIATARCKLDNGPFVNCSGQYKPTATAGLHALTIRFTDVAGNSDDQVFAFNVVPAAAPTTPPASASTPPANNDEAPRAKVCKVLGAAGLTTGRMRITGASGSGRALTLTLSAGTPGIVQVDALAGAATLGSAPFAVKSGSNKLSLKLTRAPAAGSALGLAVRFYSVKREFGTARLSLAVKGSTLKPAAGAQSTLDVTCPVTSGDAAGAKFSAAGAKVGSGGFKLSSSSKRPAVVALKVFRSGSSLPIANTIFAIGAGKQTSTVKLLGGAKFARDGYKFTFDALGPGGRESAGRGAFIAR